MKIALLLILALGSAATAAPTPPAPSAEDLYTEGQAAYDHADYSTAIDRWQTAYEISGAGGLLFNLAQAMRLSGDCPRALSTYKKFIDTDADPTSEQHRLAEDLERELAAKCPEPAAIVHHVEPPASVTPPSAIIGDHDDHDQGRSINSLRIAGIATSGAGLALLVTGLVVGHHANALGSEVSATCAASCDWASEMSKDSAGRRDASIGYALDGVGAAAILSGAIMYYLGDQEHAVSVAPATHASGAVISWSGSW